MKLNFSRTHNLQADFLSFIQHDIVYNITFNLVIYQNKQHIQLNSLMLSVFPQLHMMGCQDILCEPTGYVSW